MPKLQQIFILDITPEKFLQNCTPSELKELDLLLSNNFYQNRMNSKECRVCGCSDCNCNQCFEKNGEPCYWIEEDLCSACATNKIENNE